MAWTKNQQQYAEYVIGSVESGCDYAAVNMYDAITLGIGQFWGPNAAGLLEALKDGASTSYEKLSDRLKDTLDAHPSSDSSFWSNFYVYQDDADSWVSSAQDKENHAVQDQYFMEWVFGDGGAFDTIGSWGMNTDNPQQTILMLVCYHQYPAAASTVIRNLGGERSLDEYLTAILSTSPVSSYPNRYNEAYNLLKDWDGESAPPDFGQSDYTPDSNPDTNGQVQSSVNRIEACGNDLIVYGDMGTGNRLICHNNGNGVWLPVRNATGGTYPSTGGDSHTPSGSALEDFNRMKALWLEYAGQFAYAQAPGRLDPVSSGFTDCSAGIWWGVNAANDYRYQWLGTSTWTMWDTATFVCEGVDEDKMLAGDILLMKFPSGDEHVGMYWDDGTCWGCGSAGCPKQEVSSPDGYWSWGITYLAVYRVFGE